MRAWPVVALLLLTGCAMTPAQQAALQQKQQTFLASRPRCVDPRHCEALWAAARNWVTSNCAWKIQTMTDSYIETFNSNNATLACRVTKDPDPAGGYVLSVTTTCGMAPFCYPDVWDAAFAFNQAVSYAGEAFRPKVRVDGSAEAGAGVGVSAPPRD